MSDTETGKSTKNANMPLIWGVVIGVGLIAYGIYSYVDLAAWENTYEEKRLNKIIALLYDLGGKLTVAGFFIVTGIVSVVNGYKKTNKLKASEKKLPNAN